MAEGDVAAGEDRSRRINYVDLVLGGWRPREAAFQLAAGLGVDLGPIDGGGSGPFAAGDARAVDAEAEGDPLVNRAWDDACRIVRALPGGAIVVVLAPRFDLPIRPENEWFFLFLRRLGQAVVLIGEEPPMTATGKSPFERRRSVVAPEWEIRPDQIGPERMRLLRFFPGLLPRRIAETAGATGDQVSLIAAGPGYFLIPTGFRDTDPRLAASDFDALEEIEAVDDGLKTFAQVHCTGHFADAALLVDLARRHFRAGSPELAHVLLARALSVARRPATVAECELARLEFAAAERRFTEIVTAPALSPRAPASCVERRRALADWAVLAAGGRTGAEDVVAPSLKRLGTDERIDPGEVARLDLIVRARQAAGDFDGAMSLARSIAAALAHAGDDADQRLVFANAMSLARLHAARREAGAFAGEIDRGFDTALGARNAGDILALNVLHAKARRDPAPPAAPLHWLRAGLVWLGHEPHEGLSRGAIEAVLGPVAAARPDLDGDMANALADGLAQSWPAVAAREAARLPFVSSPATPPAIAPERMFGGPGAAILWSAETLPAPPPTDARARLIGLVQAVLGAICPAFAKVEGGTILVDANLGIDVPRSRDEALSVALRFPVEEFVYGEETVKLDQAERSRLAAELDVRLSPIVRRVADDGDAVLVGFKRYLPELRLAGAEAVAVSRLRSGARHVLVGFPMVTDIPAAELDPLLRRLEEARVVRLDARP